MKSVLNAASLRNHFSYSWWKYLLVVVLGIMGVSLTYALTSPKVPDDRKIEVIVCGASMEQDFNDYMLRVRADQMPDMDLMEVSVIPDDDTAIQYLTVRIGTQGGDIYILPRSQFERMVYNGALLPLDDDAELMTLLEDVDLETGWGTEPNSREKHIYGIPLKSRTGLSQFARLDQYFYVENGYLCILRYGKNPVNAMKFFKILCQDMMSDLPGLKAPRIYDVGLTVLGDVADSGFQDKMDLLLAEHTDGNIRVVSSVKPDMSAFFPGFYDAESDIFILPYHVFLPLAQEGDFIALENDELMQYLDPLGPDYWVTDNKSGAANLYGIPLDQLPGLCKYFIMENGVLCVRTSDENAEHVMKVLRILCREMR